MKSVVTRKKNIAQVALAGQVTFTNSEQFKALLDLPKQDKLSLIEIDFTGVDFIDSSGLGMLLTLRSICQDRQIILSVYGVHGQVEKIFGISKFDQLFSVNP